MKTVEFRSGPLVWKYLRFTAVLIPVFDTLAVASLRAQTAPTITRQPPGMSRSLGASAAFTVNVTGDAPLSYQWRFQNSDLVGANNPTLTITNLVLANAGAYSVVVSNPAGSAVSDPVELDIDPTFTKVSSGDFVKNSEWSGVAFGDYDGDGFLDLYCGGPYVYRNDPARPGEFKRVSIGGGISGNPSDGIGVWADYDNDGKLDLFVPQGGDGNSLANVLLHNEGNGGFKRITTGTFLKDIGPSFGAAWGDYDRDGYLDLFCANYSGTSVLLKSYLYHNNRDGTFTRVSDWDIATSVSHGFACNWTDVNGDGWPDLTVGVNPGGQAIYWENQQGKGFERFIFASGGGYINGPCWADFDNSGILSAIVTYSGLQPSRLIRNDGQGNFEPVIDNGLTTITQGNGGTWGDFDNDGWLDFFLPRTGYYVQNTSNTNSLWHNNGDGTFTQILRGSLVNDASNTSTAAWADFDNDGFLDLAVGGGGSAKNLLYRNNGNSNSWLTLRLIGTKSNRSAVGAKIRVTARIRDVLLTQLREIGSDAVFAQNDPRPHFGLGDATIADRVLIEWPSGQVQELTNVPGKQFLTVTEPDDRLKIEIEVNALSHQIILSVAGLSGTDITIQSSHDLPSWTDIAQQAIGTDGITVFQQSNRDPVPQKTFFRAVKR